MGHLDDDIAQTATRLASEFLDANSHKLADMANGDLDAQRDAANVLQQLPHSRRPSLSPEHVAFALITAAYELAHDRAA